VSEGSALFSFGLPFGERPCDDRDVDTSLSSVLSSAFGSSFRMVGFAINGMDAIRGEADVQDLEAPSEHCSASLIFGRSHGLGFQQRSNIRQTPSVNRLPRIFPSH